MAYTIICLARCWTKSPLTPVMQTSVWLESMPGRIVPIIFYHVCKNTPVMQQLFNLCFLNVYCVVDKWRVVISSESPDYINASVAHVCISSSTNTEGCVCGVVIILHIPFRVTKSRELSS